MGSDGLLARRDVVRGGLAGAGVWVLGRRVAALEAGDELVPFLDAQPKNPARPMIQWEELDSWMTPNEKLFAVSHYGVPENLDEDKWRLRIEGMVHRPVELTMKQIKAMPKVEAITTLECSGNGVAPGFMGAVGNVKWTGTRLATILHQRGIQPGAREVVFFGTDRGIETIRENKYEQQFARSLWLPDATDGDVILAYAMNDKPLERSHGYPLRLVVPGWYGVAWVKWLERIEVTDRRFMGKFMARDYVTIRGEKRGEEVVWRETSVSRMNVKSIVARVVKRADGNVEVFGAAWSDGTPIKTVELRIDDGPWVLTKKHKEWDVKYGWTFWRYVWKDPGAGEHTMVSRATDAGGRVQPAADAEKIALKKTYWEANQQVVRRIKI